MVIECTSISQDDLSQLHHHNESISAMRAAYKALNDDNALAGTLYEVAGSPTDQEKWVWEQIKAGKWARAGDSDEESWK
jgi:hypothetical protein